MRKSGVGRIEELIEANGGVAQLVGPRDAWQAAAIVSDRFPGRGDAGLGSAVRQVANWFRLTFLNRAVINRERTAVIGFGGTRLRAVVAISLAAAWAAPRLSKPLLAATTGLVAVAALRRGRMRRLVWITMALRRDAPDAVLVGEFAARESGAGLALAVGVVELIGAEVTLALTVLGIHDRRARSLVSLYERRLQFDVVARHSVGSDEVVLMVRRATPVTAPSLRAAGSGP
jgi:hypothetical protein